VDTAGFVFRGVPLAAGRVVLAQPPPPPRAAAAPPPRLSPAAQAFRNWGGAEGALAPPGHSPAAAAPGAEGGAGPPAERASPHVGAQAWPGPPPAAELPAELSPLPDLAPPPPPPLLPLASPAAGAAPGSAFRAFAHAGPLFRAPPPPAPAQLALPPSALGWPQGGLPWQPLLRGGAASGGTPEFSGAPASGGAGQGSGSGRVAAAAVDQGAALLRDALRAHAVAGERGAGLLLPQSVPVGGGCASAGADRAGSDASAARVRDTAPPCTRSAAQRQRMPAPSGFKAQACVKHHVLLCCTHAQARPSSAGVHAVSVVCTVLARHVLYLSSWPR
jgi:hypothetical protein